MSQSQTFTCPKCGAPQDYRGGSAPTIQCPYCDTTLIVPEALRTGSAGTFNARDWGKQAGVLTEIKRLADGGNKIAAIKLYRETFGTGLKEAKDAVEAIEQGRNVQMAQVTIGGMGGFNVAPTASGVQVARTGSSGCASWIIVLVVIVVVGSIVLPILFSVGALSALLPGSINETSSIIALASDTATPRPSPTSPPTPTPMFANVVSQFGSKGTGVGKMSDARAITVNNTGDVFVGEYLGGRVQDFDTTGKFKNQCLLAPKLPMPALAADRRGNLFVLQASTITQYNAETCDVINTFKPASGSSYESIVIGADGMLYATTNVGQTDGIVRIDNNGSITPIIDNAIGGQTGDFELEPKLAIDGQGNYYVLGHFAGQVFKFDRSGKFVNTIGSQGQEPGQFSAVNAIAVDSQGRIYVSDTKGVQVFAPDGRYLDVFKIPTSVASGMAFDDEDNLWITAREMVYQLKLK